MTLGVVMLMHTAFDRAEEVVRHLAAAGCPVVIHIDKPVNPPAFARFRDALSDLPDVRFSPRFRCEWGSWGMVAATQAAATQLLAEFPQVRHVYLMSGSCLPLRPVAELISTRIRTPTSSKARQPPMSPGPWAACRRNASPCVSPFHGSATAACSTVTSNCNGAQAFAAASPRG